MFGLLSQHELRKKLLVAESEINRAQLIREVDMAKVETEKLAQETLKLTAIISTVVVVFAGLRTLRRGFSHSESNKTSGSAPKGSLLKKILNGARFASTIWTGFRAAGHNGKHEAVKP